MSFRAFHTAIAAEQLLAIAYVWWCAITGRRDRLLRIAVATLISQLKDQFALERHRANSGLR